MACEICGRGNCTRSFHSLEEQEKYDKYSNKTERELISELIDRDDEIEFLTKLLDEYESTQCGCCDHVDR